MNGTITGGWGFVSAAYTITATLLGMYAMYAVALFRRHKRR